MHHHDEGRAGVLRKGREKLCNADTPPAEAPMATMTGSLSSRTAAPLVLSLALSGTTLRSPLCKHIQESGRGASKFRQLERPGCGL
jgi:hypothetical protein